MIIEINGYMEAHDYRNIKTRVLAMRLLEEKIRLAAKVFVSDGDFRGWDEKPIQAKITVEFEDEQG